AVGGLADAGLKRVVVVIGYGADQIAAHIDARSWPVSVETIRTDDYRKPNGTSVLAAAPVVGNEEALLAMCDHLVEPDLYRRVAGAGASGGARLGVDRRIDSGWIDVDDASGLEKARCWAAVTSQVEHRSPKPRVVGSSPSTPATFAG